MFGVICILTYADIFVFIHLGLCHRYKNYTVVITIRLTIMKYPYLNWQWIFYFLCRCFLSSITANTFSRLDCIYVKNGECYIRRRNCLPFASTWVHPRCFGGVSVAHLLTFLFCPFMYLYVLSSVLWCQLRFQHKNDVRFVVTSGDL